MQVCLWCPGMCLRHARRELGYSVWRAWYAGCMMCFFCWFVGLEVAVGTLLESCACSIWRAWLTAGLPNAMVAGSSTVLGGGMLSEPGEVRGCVLQGPNKDERVVPMFVCHQS